MSEYRLKSSSNRNRWFCVQERAPEPNPLDIWYMMNKWTQDKVACENLLNDLQKIAIGCACKHEWGEIKINNAAHPDDSPQYASLEVKCIHCGQQCETEG